MGQTPGSVPSPTSPKPASGESCFLKVGVGSFLDQLSFTNYYLRPVIGNVGEEQDVSFTAVNGLDLSVAGGIDFPDHFSLFLSGERMTWDWSLMANVQWTLAEWGWIEPYFYAGLGADYFQKTSSGLGAQLGIGLNFPLDPNASVFIEAKAEGGFGWWMDDLVNSLDYRWADYYFPVITGLKYSFPSSPNTGNSVNAAAPLVSASRAGPGASGQYPVQRLMVEADYGAPLFEGFSVGYLIDPCWEASVGISLATGYAFQTSASDSVQLSCFRFSILGRYNLAERKALEPNFFQPYLSFGYDVTVSNQTSVYVFDDIGVATEQDLQLGAGLEYFILSDLGIGLTANYIEELVFTASASNRAYHVPYAPWNSPSLSADFPFVPSCYLQFRI